MANTLDAFVPELWAQESLVILEENMVAANLVHRDFENTIQNFGDVVNTRRPGEYVAKRKQPADDVTLQDSTATNVPVKLDQHVHVSFIIRDSEQSKSFKDLVDLYLHPALLAQARFCDQVILGQYPHFLDHSAGGLGTMTNSNSKKYLLDTRSVMNKNKAHSPDRNMIWTPDAETDLLNTDIFLTADKVGDDGTALREASLGKKLGFSHFMCQNMASVPTTAVDKVTGAINAGNLTKGSTALTVDGFSAAIGNNSFIAINGYVYRVVSTVGGATPTTINIKSPGLHAAIADNDVVTVIDPGAVNNGSGYAAAHDGYITFDGFTNAPVAGQAVSFGTSSTNAIYSIVEVSGSTMLLDRPLEAALSDNDAINVSPDGDYNLAFHRDALAFVIRPLAAPAAGAGALSAVVNWNGLSMRATIAYNHLKQGHVVTVDMLCGVKVLDEKLGAVLLA